MKHMIFEDVCGFRTIVLTTPPGRRRRTVRTDSISVEDGSHGSKESASPPKNIGPKMCVSWSISVFF